MDEDGHSAYDFLNEFRAGIAQLVEQLICNQQVAGSSPVASSSLRIKLRLASQLRFGPRSSVGRALPW